MINVPRPRDVLNVQQTFDKTKVLESTTSLETQQTGLPLSVFNNTAKQRNEIQTVFDVPDR